MRQVWKWPVRRQEELVLKTFWWFQSIHTCELTPMICGWGRSVDKCPAENYIHGVIIRWHSGLVKVLNGPMTMVIGCKVLLLGKVLGIALKCCSLCLAIPGFESKTLSPQSQCDCFDGPNMENVLHELLRLITNNPSTVDTKSKKCLTFLQKLLVWENHWYVYTYTFFLLCPPEEKKNTIYISFRS